MTAPAALPASFVKLSMLTDGTIRLVLDVEPKDRSAAFAVFDKPGVPVALARLTNEAAVQHDRAHADEAQPADPLPAHKLPTPLSSRVAMTCAEHSFVPFLRSFDPNGFGAVERSGIADPVKQYVRDYCGVTSRSEIKAGTEAAAAWSSLKAQYEHWQRQGEAA